MHIESIKGVLFDYGGTIDSNGMHWAEVIRKAYQKSEIPIEKNIFREAYVYGERTLGKHPIVKPHHTFRDMMQLKMDLQFEWLKASRALPEKWVTDAIKKELVDFCYDYAAQSIEHARPVIQQIAARYPLVLVSNFYGNIASVLKDFHLDGYFPRIIESAVVGVRKPDPRIFEWAVEALHLLPDEVVVVGDSYDKDVVPARSIGCRTIWLKGAGWNAYSGDETADVVIHDFTELETVFQLGSCPAK